jgi:triphosphatase
VTDALDTRELEVKFRLGRGGIRAFKKAVQLAAGAKKTWARNRLVSRYFDTDDHRLAARSVSLRVRSTAGGFVQTLKAAKTTGGGLMDRSEWETPVATNELDIDELPPEARRALGVVVAGELVPMIDVDFERQTVVVERTNPLGTDLKVEIAIDTGVVKAAGRS